MTTEPLPDTPAYAIQQAFLDLGGVQRNSTVFKWIAEHYPNRWEERRLGSYLRACSVNHPLAIKLHPSYPRFLYNRAKGEFELYDQTKHGLFDESGYQDGQVPVGFSAVGVAEEAAEEFEAASIFAVEAHLRDYLVNNLGILEKGLGLWSVQPPSVEYVVQNRRIDLLAKDASGLPVVIELKLSKSYDRVIGQALLYRGLVSKYLGAKRVRIVLVAGEISDDLKIACAGISDLQLFEYSLSFQTKIVSLAPEEGV